jgi:hypothetical protein
VAQSGGGFTAPAVTVPATRLAPTAPAAAPVPGAAALSLIAPPQVKPGSQFTLAVNLASPKDVKTLSFELVYDGDEVEVVNAAEGAFMKQGGDTPKVTQTPGSGRHSFSFARTASGATGVGAVAQLTLRIKENEGGTTQFSIENAAAQDAAGQAVPVTAPQPSVVNITP